MKNNDLYIVGGNCSKLLDDINKEANIIFLDKVHQNFTNHYPLIKIFNKKQDFLRNKWLELQGQVFKKIEPLINKDKDFDYILSNLFFEASPYKSSSIFIFFKIQLIIDYLKKKKIKKIFLLNIEIEIEIFFKNNSKNLSIEVQKISNQKKKLSIKKLIKSYNLINIIQSLISELKIKNKKIYPHKNESKKVIFSYFPGYTFEKKFMSKYLSEVSSLIKDDYAWLFFYVGNKKMMNQQNEMIRNGLNSFGFLESYFSLIDLKKILLKFLKIKKKLNSIDYKNLFIFEGINYLDIFKSEWIHSINFGLLKIIIFEKKFSNFLSINSKIKEIIYLMEYQDWELMLNKVAQKHCVKTKGIIHIVVRPNLMNYYHSKLIHQYLYKPSFVGVNSDFSKSLLLKNGFNEEQILKIEAQRFNYLADVQKNAAQKIQPKNSILIITSINFKETKELLEVFAISNIKFEKVYIKEHPHLKVSPIIKNLNTNFPTYELVKGSVIDAFSYSEIIYIANGSSVLLESVLCKKITVSLISLSTLPMPAIDKASNLHFVYDSHSLSDKLNKFKTKSDEYQFSDDKFDYLYLDKKLNLWKDFIKK